MSYISVDVESDGPIIGEHSMVCFGAIVVDDKLDKTFYGKTAPISTIFVPEALAVSGITREEHKWFPEPKVTMLEFKEWLKTNSTPPHIFIADNPAYDFAWINYYFLKFTGGNPFGWSGRRIGDLWCGMQGDTRSSWKHLRKTKHTHNPVDDAMGNAEAILTMRDMGLKIKL